MDVPYNYLPQQFADPQKFFDLWEPLGKSGDFTRGQYVDAFENNFAQFVGSRHCISTNNGTDALVLSLKAIGVGPGDDVVTACNSFYATAGAIVAAGAQPIFADVDDRYQIDLGSVERVMTERTRAILPVHWAGASPDMFELMEFAKAAGLSVVEDACMGIGGSIRGRHPGTFGEVGAFSMHPLKTLNVMGDGGMIVTDDDEMAAWMRKYRNHGMTDRDHIEFWGVNMRLQPLQAVVADELLTDLPDVVQQRNENAAFLDAELRKLEPQVKVPRREDDFLETYSLYMVQVTDRDELLTYLHQNGVDAKIHYPVPLHRQAAAVASSGVNDGLPEADNQAERILTLPVHQYLRPEQLEFMTSKVSEFYLSRSY